MTISNETSYNDGWEAFELGLTLADNPFKDGTELAVAWEHGWDEAKDTLDYGIDFPIRDEEDDEEEDY